MSGPEKRLVRSKSGLRILPTKESEQSPFELNEPEWVKDNQSSACSGCKASFDFVRRKHHCRRCGQIYCNTCSKTRLALPRMCFLDPVRLCCVCAKKTLEENNFYENDLKILTTGTLLKVSDIPPDSDSRVLYCALSANHRCLLLSGIISQSIPLVNITVVSSSENDENQNKSLSSLSFVVNGENAMTELKAPSSSTQAFLWSLQKAFQMTEEARAVIGTGE